MKNKLALKIISLALAVVAAASLTGCGKNLIQGVTGLKPGAETTDENTNTAEATVDPNKKYFKVDYVKDAKLVMNNVQNSKFMGDKFFYSNFNDDYTKSTIASYDFATQTSKVYFESLNSSSVTEDPGAEHEDVNRFSMDSDGNMYFYVNKWHYDTKGAKLDFSGSKASDVIKLMSKMWEVAEDVAADNLAYYENEDNYKTADGKVDYDKIMRELTIYNLPMVSSTTIDRVLDNGERETIVVTNDGTVTDNNHNSYCQSFEVDKNGNVYTLISEYNWGDGGDDNYSEKFYIDVYDNKGKKKTTIDLDMYVDQLVNTNGVVGYGQWLETYQRTDIDPDTLKVKEPVDLGNNGGISVEFPDGKLLVQTNVGLDKVDAKTAAKENYINWLDNDISASSVNAYNLLSDGRLAVFINTWDNKEQKYNCELATLSEIPYTEVVPKVELKLATTSLDTEIESKILDFNRHNNDYRVTVEQFDWSANYDDYDAAMKEFYAKLIADKSIDMIWFNSGSSYQVMNNFASKGLLIDLTDYINNEGTVTTDKLIPSAKNALTMDGKLLGVSTYISAQTLAGKKSVVGDKAGWTIEEMNKIYKSQPKGTELISGNTRANIIEACLNVGYTKYIDRANSKCDFNNDAFKSILELAKDFPEEIDWDKYYADYESYAGGYKNGKIMLQGVYLNDVDSLRRVQGTFGEEITAVGFPCESGNGVLLSMGNIFTITKNCEAPEQAIKIIAPLFARNYKDDGTKINANYYSGSVPVRTDDFDAYCKYVLSPEGQQQFSDTIWVEDGGMGEGGTINVGPVTQEQLDILKDLFYNASGVEGALPAEVLAIINEEAGAYFSDQKTADEVAQIIQSRVQIYLSETE